jgi:hypothetical protein
MIVYRDILTGDEVCTDAFNVQEVKDSDGAVVRIKACVNVFFLSFLELGTY